MVTEAGPEPDAVFTSLFIGNVDDKRVCFSCITLRCYRECVFTAFFVIQKKRDRVLRFLQEQINDQVELMTAFNVTEVNVEVRGIE